MSISKKQCITFIKLHKVYYGDEILNMEDDELEEIIREIKKDVLEEIDDTLYDPDVVYDLDMYDFFTWYIITIVSKKNFTKQWKQLLKSIVYKK
ncbi:MAG: hypothetical protein EBU66_19115 [Bacteroidetes bacterium]|nr:hypothetical protein [Bacteroidota bacterium]